MTAPVEQSRRYTLEEYLRFEESSQEKHEFRNGEIICMSGGTYDHSLIASNLLRSLSNQLAASGCRVLGSDLRVRIPKKLRYCYPDVTVVCEAPQFDPASGRSTIMNPQVLVEVLSPSTEAMDRGEKLHHYLEIESLREYLLVSQTEARVDAFFHQAQGDWVLGSATGLRAIFKFRSLSATLSMKEIYSGVTVPPQSEPPQGDEPEVH